jgi:uncharacterized protein DUF1559
VALANYHDRHGYFPPAVTTDGQGKVMHGWGVYLLPFLDETGLYLAYNFAHAYDAAENSTVARTILPQFQCPGAQGIQAQTHYRMVVCPGSAMGKDRWPQMKDITDARGQTIVVMEMGGAPVPWTSPRAIVDPTRGINAKGAGPSGYGSEHEGGCLVLMADGTTLFLSDQTRPDVLRALATASGGEKLADDDF